MPTSLRNPFIAFATIGYLLFSLAWIWLTDQLLVAFADVASMVWLSTAKGLFFVVASAAFFFMAMRAVPTDRQSGAPPSLDTLLIAAMPEQPRPHALVFVVAASLSLLSLALREGMGGQVADQPMLMLFQRLAGWGVAGPAVHGPGVCGGAVAGHCAGGQPVH